MRLPLFRRGRIIVVKPSVRVLCPREWIEASRDNGREWRERLICFIVRFSRRNIFDGFRSARKEFFPFTHVEEKDILAYPCYLPGRERENTNHPVDPCKL